MSDLVPATEKVCCFCPADAEASCPIYDNKRMRVQQPICISCYSIYTRGLLDGLNYLKTQ